MTKQAVCCRMTEQTIYKLDYLCQALGQGRTEVVSNLIASAFDDMNDNEELKALFGQLKDIEGQVQALAESISKN